MDISQWFKGIRLKLLICTLLPLIALTTTSIYAYRGISQVGSMLSDAYQVMIPSVTLIEDMLVTRNGMNYYMTQALMRAGEPALRAKSLEKFAKAWEEFQQAQAAYEKTEFSPDETMNYNVIKNNKTKFYALTEKILVDTKKNDAAIDKITRDLIDEGEWQGYVREIRVNLEKNVKIYKDLSVANDVKQKALRDQLTMLLIAVTAISSLLLIVLMVSISSKLANGVSKIVLKLTEISEQVAMAITQLTTSGQLLSQSTTENAASLEETVASVEELTSMVNLNSKNAGVAADLSNASTEAAGKGAQEINSLITTMDTISQSSKKIEEIISVIDDIAFQTNLLALNAAVEAARAGEQGKGFAVVAEAVRTLAQRSAVAAKDISKMIKDSVNEVEQGTKIAGTSGQMLGSIVESVKKVSGLNSEIATASTEQAEGIKQISVAMNQMDQTSQANAAASEEIAATAEEISAQAAQMQKVVVELQELVIGK